MKIQQTDTALLHELERIAEVAGYLWERGWAERNGGNISDDVTDLFTPVGNVQPFAEPVALAVAVPYLEGRLFYVTGTGKRMRYVAKAPLDHGSIIRIGQGGKSYEVIAEQPIQPTSEISSHLMMHNYLRSKGRDNKIVLHTHPTDLIALTHCRALLDSEKISRLLWSMIPESRIVVPGGVGIVPYRLTGTTELAEETIKLLDKHDIVFWEKHGILAVGEDIIECFDAIDTMSKSAQIYLNARQFSFEPEGLTDDQLEEIRIAFKLP